MQYKEIQASKDCDGVVILSYALSLPVWEEGDPPRFRRTLCAPALEERLLAFAEGELLSEARRRYEANEDPKKRFTHRPLRYLFSIRITPYTAKEANDAASVTARTEEKPDLWDRLLQKFTLPPPRTIAPAFTAVRELSLYEGAKRRVHTVMTEHFTAKGARIPSAEKTKKGAAACQTK